MRAPHLTVHPLSSSQREIWFDQMLHEGVALYNIGGWVDLPGEIDVEMFRTAVQMLIRRHDALRLVLMDTADEDGMPLQKVVEPWAAEVPLHDFSGEADPRGAAHAWMQARFEEPFTLIGQPLWRYDLVKMGPSEYGWLLQYHHLIVDGWGVALINRSLAEIYSSLAEQAWSEIAPSPSYTAFIASDREYVESPAFERDRAYWLAQYANGAPEPLLQARHHATAPKSEGTAGSAVQSMHLPRAMYRELEALAAEQGASVFHVLLGALYVYFTRTGQREDFAVGLPVLNRSNAQMRATAGLFVGVTPAHFQFGREITFVELIRGIGKALKGHYRHQRFPVSEINRAVGLQAARSALFDVTLSFENSGNDMDFAGIRGQLIPVLNGHAQDPLTVFVRDFHDAHDVQVDFVHNLAYLDEAEVRALQERFHVLLAAALESRGQTSVQALPVMTGHDEERLRAWNQTDADYPQDLTVVDLFEAQVDTSPDATAVVFEGQRLSYAQLDRRANQVAHALIEQGVGPDTLVGLCVPRSLEMVVGLLGILKAGGAYVPLDPDYPQDRLTFMVTDAQAQVVLSHSAVLDRLPLSEAQVLRLDDSNVWASQPGSRPARQASPHDLAYVIYTSGSTGVPKGAMNEHRGVVNRLQWMQDEYRLDAADVVLQKTPFSFDVSVWEFFWPLMTGARLVLARPGGHQEPQYLAELITHERITTLHFVPPMLGAFLELATLPAGHALRRIVCSGEALPVDLERRCLERLPEVGLHNLYGPTEAAVDVTYWPCEPGSLGESVPIGRPVSNTRVHLLDTDQQPVPPGVPGELCIAGVQVGRGYLNRPELTAEKFIVAEVLGRAERLYRTGDLARWLPDGNLEYLGRLDHQVKLRGFRIELGEVESALSAHEAVSAAAVVLREREGVKALAGYVVLRSAVEVSELKGWLKARLPEYMVPSSLTVLESLPLTPNGKVDRRALPEPELAVSVGRALSGPTEELLGGIWAEVLGLASLSAESNFFELGGHSLLATRVASRIRTQLGVDCPLRVLLEQPVLVDLAAWLDTQQRGSAVETIAVLAEGEPLVLSPAQERLWFLAQLEGASSTYNMPAALRLSGELDEAALRASLVALTCRQASLRQSFPVDAAGQVRLAERAPWDPLELADLQHLDPEAQAAEVERLARAHAQAPFDLATGPLFKVGLLRLSPLEHVLLLNLHHSIADGWSIAVLVREWAALYRAARAGEAPALRPLPALPVAYRDVAAWQQRWSTSEAASAQLAWWVAQLQGAPALLELPTDFPRPAQQSYRGASFSRTLDAALSQAVERLARAQGATVFMTLLAALQLVLHRHSAQSDISVGTPVANREHAQTEHLVGLFVNTLVLRSHLDPQQPFAELLAQVRHTALGAFARQALPFERVVEALSPERSLAHAPLFQVMFVLQNNDAADFDLDGLQITPVEQSSSVAKVDLTLSAQQTPQGILCHWEFASDLFTQARIERLARHFEQALQVVTAQPDTPLQAIDILTQDDKAQLLAWNRTEADYPQDLTVVDLFERQVDQTPDATAVVFEGQALSYAQLDKQANQVAHALIEQGIQPDTLVGLCVPRSLEMVVGLLGILKAGGAYVPLDPDYPPERLAFMVTDAQARVVLSHSSVLQQLPQSQAAVLMLDQPDLWACQPDIRPARRASPQDLAYVIYTSGSTGVPKGVMIAHAALSNFLADMQPRTDIQCGQTLLAVTTLSFDIAALELYLPLVSGASVHLASREMATDARQLQACLHEQVIDLMQATPATWRMLLESGWQQHRPLTVLCGGEALPRDLGERLLAQARLLWNVYGPTETTIWSAAHAVTQDPERLGSIGRPIANTKVYILDAQQRVLPPGVPGELCIAGAGLARGYLNRPELTAEKFITAEVLGHAERLYRTGDLARWLPDGNLEYLGRLDHQVKLRGFRIELGEIESALSAHEAVSAAAVVLRQPEGTEGVKALAGYVVLRSAVEVSELKGWLKARLPEYMVPSSLTVLESLPLTPNGKVDRRALPEPELAVSVGRALSGPTEELLGGIWAEVLGLASLSAESNFFELGGHSLLATRVASRIRTQLGVDCPLRVLLEQPVLVDLAAWLDTQQRGSAVETIAVLAEGEPLVLSPAQERLWFLAQLEGASSTYNMPAALRLSGELDEAALRASLVALTCRQASLRQSFPVDAAGQVRLAERAPWDPLELADLQHLDPEAQAAEVERLARAHAQAPFDLATGPLFKVGLLRLSPLEHVLLLNLHHSIADGWSIAVLVREWAALYRAARAGEAPALRPLPALPVAYRDVAAWQQRWSTSEAASAQLAWWVAQLQGAPALLELPTDFPRPAQQSYRGASFSRTLDAALSQAVERLARAQGATVFMTLLAALQLVLHRHSAQSDISVGTPVANREHAQTEHLVGLFVNTLVLRSHLDPQQPFAELLAQVRHTALGAFARQALPFERVVEALSPERSLAHAPLFQVMFVLQNNDAADFDLDGLQITPVEQSSSVAKVDLTLSAQQTPQGILCHWEFASDLFTQARIERLARHFEQALQVVTAQPDTPLQAIDILTQDDKAQLLAWNRTEADYPQDLTVVDLFERQVDQTPDATAVVFEGQALSYAQLDKQANQVAHALIEQGIQPDTLVGLCVPRSLEMVVGLLGILKAGGAYVPLDPDYPPERLAFMVQDSKAPVLLSHSAVLDRLPPSQAAVLQLDQPVLWAGQPVSRPSRQASPHDLAYVIYTSGSTGTPKGVLLQHGGAVNLAFAQIQAFDTGPGCRVLQFAAFSFDAAAWEVLMALGSGAALHLAPSQRLREDLMAVLQQQAITHVTLPPSMLAVLPSERLPALRTLVVAGEACPPALLSVWAADRLFYNAYGPTETTVCATIASCTAEMTQAPIGVPLANTRIYILDAQQRVLPPGVPGELCIAGAGLARGYLNRPDLTAEKFITADVLGKAERLYRTGDLARRLPDGNLEYLGRLDHQVKLRGFRIELGEIESALGAHSAVSAAAVVLREREGVKALAGYVVLRAAVEVSELKGWLKARLPEYMVPSSLTVLESLPLTPNGKVDRRALPEPELAVSTDWSAPRSAAEQTLCAIWSAVLRRSDIGIHDNFFDLGGDSILSIQIVARARQAGLGLSARDVFEHQSVAELAQVVRAVRDLDAPQGAVRGLVPLTPIQARFFEAARPAPWHYNQAMLLRVPLLQERALRSALAAVLAHHDALRLRYTLDATTGEWLQSHAEVEPESVAPLHVEDLDVADTLDATTDAAAWEAELQARADHWQASLDLEKGPLTRLVLLRCPGAPERTRLLWVIHHLAVDGVSWRILLEDLQRAYAQAAAGEPAALPAKTSSFQGWSTRLQRWGQSAAFAEEAVLWQDRPALPALRADHPEGAADEALSAWQTFTLDADLTAELLHQVPAAFRTGIQDVLVSALALALHEHGGQSRMHLDLESHGRAELFADIDLGRTVGWFTSLYSVEVDLGAAKAPGQILLAVKEALRAIPHEGLACGVLEQQGQRVPHGTVLFNYLGQFDQIGQDTADGWTLAREGAGQPVQPGGQRSHLLAINGSITHGQLSLSFDYSTAQFEAASIEALIQSYGRHLRALITHCRDHFGLSPSDFALATLDQPSLDRLSRDHGRDLETLYPLSPMQHGMLFHSLVAPGSGAYITQMSLGLSRVEPAHLKAAWQGLVERHAILRSAVRHDMQPPVQVVLARVELPWREVEARDLDEAAQASLVEQILQQDRRDFDFAQAPLMRLSLVDLSHGQVRLLWSHHHLLMDGWCLPILFQELFVLYEASRLGQPSALPPVQRYQHYIAWIARQDQEQARAHWRERLLGFDTPTPVTIARHVPADVPKQPHDLALTLDAPASAELQRWARSQRLTLNAVVLGAWATLLGRYAGTDDVVFGATTSGRNVPLPGIEHMVGLFINTLPLRASLRSTALELARTLQAQQQADNAFAYSSLADIQAASDIPAGASLFDTLVVFENYPVDEALKDQRSQPFGLDDIQAQEGTNYALTLAVLPGHALGFKLSFDAARVEPASAQRLLSHFAQIVRAITVTPELPAQALEILTQDDKAQLLAWNRTEADYPQDLTVVDLFERQVDQTPDATAVVFEGQALSYAQLDKQANQVAHALIEQGIQPDTLVGLCVPRSLEMVVGLLGILKAGGAYVPLDPDYPPERLAFMVQDSKAPVLLSHSAVLDRLPPSQAAVLQLDQPVLWAGQPVSRPSRQASPHDLAYVIYTSGSTGTPKGCLMTHANISRLFSATEAWFHFGPTNTWTLFHSYAFDFSVWEIWGALAHGGRLVIVPYLVSRSPDLFRQLLLDEQVTVLNQTPSAFLQLIQADTACTFERFSLKWIIFGGEALELASLRPWFERHGDVQPQLVNMYGITETTVHVTYHALDRHSVTRGSSVIGRAIPDLRIYLLDRHLNPVPPGVAGEMHVAGAGLARGYLNRPELTAEKFITADVLGKTERLYRTGDLARWLPDGNLEYLGRIDHQVKLRGFRIELGEIESALSAHEAVSAAAAVLRERAGVKALAGYVILRAAVEVSELKVWLKSRLPEYMVPASVTVLQALPLTPNGKVDRRALPEPEMAVSVGRPLSGPTEEVLGAIWAEVLGLEGLTAEVHFFELGGHSLLATRVASRIRAQLGVDCPLRVLFEQPVLADLAAWLDAQQRGSVVEVIEPLPAGSALVLSPAQERLWFLAQLEGASSTYNMPAALRLSGELDEPALRASLTALTARQASLRQSFPVDESGQARLVERAPWDPLELTDLQHLAPEAQAAEIERLARAHAQAPFDLAAGPLFKVGLLRLNPQEHVLLINLHHSIGDGWSIAVLVREWAELYRSARAGKVPALQALPVAYRDVAAWQQRWSTSEAASAQLAWWVAQLQGAPALLELPTDFPRPAQQSYRGSSFSRTLDPALSQAVERLARAQGATVFMTLLGALQLVLHRHSGQSDISVGTPVANREHAQTEHLVGLFVNTLVIRSHLDPQRPFADLLAQVRHTSLGAFARQALPFERVVEALSPERSLAHAPLFQVMFVLQNNDSADFELDGLTLSPVAQSSSVAKVDLTLSAQQTPEGILCHWEFASDLFTQARIERLASHFAQVLDVVTRAPETPLLAVDILTSEDKAQLRVWNQTEADYPADLTVVDLFEAQVDQTPDATAVVFEGQALSYIELDQRANQVAHALIEQGIQPDTLVGLCVPRSLEMVVGLLGILKAGGAYVPLDPDYPQERLAFMVSDSNAPVVLTHSAVLDRLPRSEAQVLRLDDANAWAAQPDTRPARRASPRDLAYVIYTSGSTGVPKGVLVEHRGLANHMHWLIRTFDLHAQDRILQRTPFSFDASVWEFHAALLTGATLVVAAPERHGDADYLQDLIDRQRITVLQCVPSLLQVVLDQRTAPDTSLRQIFCGGEMLEVGLQRDFARRWPQAALHNLYGPTEATIDASGRAACQSHPAASIGAPIANTRVYILDEAQRVLPPGVPGELCIAGAGLARGYLNRPELTAEKFITADVLGKTERLYRTGDLARWLPDGNLEYLGRIDHQVKLRGFRIELGEIESALSAHEAVSAAAAVLRERAGVKALAGYVILRAAVEVSELKVWLKSRLPEYMVPASVTVLQALPLTPNGKVDRRALPEPEMAVSVGRPLSGPTEEVLGAIWAEVLGLGSLTAEAHFFELGGHSLLATRVASRIRAQLGVDCPLRLLFEQPVLADLAAWLDAQQRGSIVEVIEPLPAGSALVLSPAQERLWFLAQLEGASSTYNMPAALRLSGELDEPALRASLTALTARQASLRQSFPVDASGQARLHECAPWDPLELVDLQHLAPEAQKAEVERLACAHAQAPFDLAAGPLFKVSLLRLGQARHTLAHVLLLNLHHSIGDGWSIAVLVREWAELYRSARAGEAPALRPLPALPVAYRDVAAWQQRWSTSEAASAQLAWWVAQLQGAPALLELPTDFPRPAQQSYRGASFSRTLDAALSQAVERLARAQGATVFMTLLAALQLVLHRHSAQSDISVGTPVANREHAQTEHLVGLFVNTLVLRSHLDPQQPFAELLAQVRHTALGAFARQALPFERVVEALSPERSLAHAPLFQVMFVLQNNDAADFDLDGLQITPVEQSSSVAKVDLTLSAQQTPQGILCHWEFASDLFTQARIERLARHFEQALQVVTAQPDTPLQAIDILTQDDKAQLLAWNRTEADYPQDLTVVDLFERQVDQTPDATAVVFEGQALSYAQLDKQANQVAHALIEQGIQPDTLVGLCVPRSLEMVVGLLGILKAGGAYVPLDPDYPPERLAFMVQDSKAPVLLSHSAVLDRLPPSQAAVLQLDQPVLWAGQPVSRPSRQASPHDLAYVIYTSGSTGTPKGCLMTHANISRLFSATEAWFHFGPTNTWTLFHSYAFDFSVWEIWGALAHGGRLVIVPYLVSRSPDLFRQLLLDEQVTVLNQTPSAFLQLIQADTACTFERFSLKWIIFGGEALELASLRPWFERHGDVQPQLVNMYGITETTVHVTYHALDRHSVTRGSSVIGRAIPDLRIYLLDRHLNPVPPGVAGEMHVAGAGLARGYLNRPELTAEKFITADVLGKTERLYRTGDLARWLPDGNLEYLGRIDHQVKLRGFRIELGEIESALSAHEAVSAAAAVLRERAGVKALAGYVILRAAVEVSELKVWLKSRLPEYMVPASVTVLQAMPLTPNGKVDRRALPEPDQVSGTHHLAPRTLTEVHLTRLWEQVLGVRPISIDANFFDLGGHSLLAIRLLACVQQHFGQQLPLKVLFRSSTVAQLADHLDAPPQADLPRHVVPIQPTGHRPALYCLPGAGGQVLYFHTLARHLGAEQPVFGLQTPGIGPGERLPDSVEAHARQLVTALRTHQPEGPYRLLGHSSGARVAFEMTRQLEQQGQCVAQLVLLDATPSTPAQAYQQRRGRSALKRMMDAIDSLEAAFEQSLDLPEAMLEALPDEDSRWQCIVQRLWQRQIVPASVGVEQVRTLFRVWETAEDNHERYQPGARVQAPVWALRASDRHHDTPAWLLDDAQWDWQPHAHFPVHVQWVAGNHNTMLNEPQVRELAGVVRQALGS